MTDNKIYNDKHNFLYLDKAGIMHAKDTIEEAKKAAPVDAKILETSFPCADGYPLVNGDETTVYSVNEMENSSGKKINKLNWTVEHYKLAVLYDELKK